MLRLFAFAAAVTAATLLPSAPAGRPQQEFFGIYGYVRRVVREPDAANPQRIQIWGTFSAISTKAPGQYHAPERGYLYFERSPDDTVAHTEWAELQQLADTGGPWTNAVGKPMLYGITAFAPRDIAVRVRTSDEKPASPDRYRSGRGVVKMPDGPEPAAVKMLGDLPSARSRMNYALIDKVIVEREPPRVQIWGVFALGEADMFSYAPPRRGYLYLAPDPPAPPRPSASDEWFQWMKLPNTGVIGFLTFNSPDQTVRVRSADEAPGAPDVYSMRLDRSRIIPDTTYAPIRELLKAR